MTRSRSGSAAAAAPTAEDEHPSGAALYSGVGHDTTTCDGVTVDDAAIAAAARLSPVKRAAMIGLVMWVLFVVAGPITGPQAIFGALAKRGVYRDMCTGTNASASSSPDDTLTCQAQEQSIESGMVLCLGICNFLCVGWGFAQDTIGARKVAVVGVVIWTVAKSLAGFWPDSGIMWTVCESIAASASLGAYSALGLEHLRQACVTDGLYAVMGFIASAAWDIAVLLNLALAQLYGWEAVTLWQAYMAYGLGAGAPVLLGLAFWPKKHDDDTNASTPEDAPPASPASDVDASQQTLKTCGGDNSSAPHSPVSSPTGDGHVSEFDTSQMSINTTTTTTNTMATDAKVAMQKTLVDVKCIFGTAIFWAFAGHCSVVVTVGYFMIANVGSLATSHNMSDRARARDVTTIIMSAMGLTSVIPGRLLYVFGTQRGLVILLAIQSVLLVAFGTLIALGNADTFYIAFGLMFAWRVWGFGLTFPFIDWRFKHCPHGVGVCYGGVFALAGGVSMAAGLAASHALHTDPQDTLRPVMLTLCGVAVAVEIFFGVLVARVDPTTIAGAAAPTADAAEDDVAAGLLDGERTA